MQEGLLNSRIYRVWVQYGSRMGPVWLILVGRPDMTIKYRKNVPTKLQMDGWWLDHDNRPFPKQLIAAKVTAETAPEEAQG